MTQHHLQFDCKHSYPSGFTLDASFALSRPITALCGASGSGKTTALSLIAGLQTPLEGKITLRGNAVIDTSSRVNIPTERRRVGLLFQDHCLLPHLNVRDNLLFGHRRIRDGKDTAISPERVIESLELDDLLDRLPNAISGGQSQRVALARAILSAPRLLLLDEPFTSLEESLQNKLRDSIRNLAGEFSIPVLIVSHNRRLIEEIADEVIEIAQGRICDE